MQTFNILFLLFGLTEALVEFTDSVMIDEYDLNGVQTLSIPKCANGCNIWASVQKQYSDYAKNLDVVADGLVQGNIGSKSEQYEENKEKSKIHITVANEIHIRNNNPVNAKGGPIIIYVAAKMTKNSGISHVYDASNLPSIRVNSPASNIFTILSAKPFTVTVGKGEYYGVTARLVGFDNVDDQNPDKCTTAYHSTSSDGFKLNVNGPIISLDFGIGTNIDIQASQQFDVSQSFDNVGYLSSPGFIGCYGGKGLDQVYRSSDYDAKVHFALSSTSKVNVTIETEVNTDAAHNLLITDVSNDNKISLTGKPPNNKYKNQVDLTSRIEVDMTCDDIRNGFILRYTSVDSNPTATTVTPTTSTTTKSLPYSKVLLGPIICFLAVAFGV